MTRKKDYAWEHCTVFVKGGTKYLKCNYCSHETRCLAITTLKKHLARIEGFVKPCPSVPQAVFDGFRDNFEEDPLLKVLRLKDKQKRVPALGHAAGQSSTSNVQPDEHVQHNADPTASDVARRFESPESTVKERDELIQMLTNRVEKAENEVARLRKRLSKVTREAAELERKKSKQQRTDAAAKSK